jgi:hypothetical protein
MPYLTYEYVRANNIIPGSQFTGKFTPIPAREAPHVEDCFTENLTQVASLSKMEFEGVLEGSKWASVSDGFEFDLSGGKRVIPKEYKSPRSIITIGVDPSHIEIRRQTFENGTKTKVSFKDATGNQFVNAPIADLGFHDFAVKCSQSELDQLNIDVKGSRIVYLRLGLSRVHRASADRDGCWVQVNGIYTFPSKINVVRGYTA